MKITQEVRDYAAKMNEAPDPPPQVGMAEMSKKFRDMGGQVYVDADKVKKSQRGVAAFVPGPV